MAKKNREQRAEGGTQSRGDASQKIKAEARTYEVGTWAGFPQWKCLLCAFDTLDEDAMIAHAEAHRDGTWNQTPPPEPNPPPLPQREEELGEVFEVELKEIGSTVDEQGNEHKTFTVKE